MCVPTAVSTKNFILYNFLVGVAGLRCLKVAAVGGGTCTNWWTGRRQLNLRTRSSLARLGRRRRRRQMMDESWNGCTTDGHKISMQNDTVITVVLEYGRITTW